ncbi:D-glycero-beta-D-manno-heptose 1-phosphate adenylyltransferase [Leptospira mayottensis]|uniref:D-glycero-beta-D-manno-heptose 1-phosphate adenylyltransferase n=2 Tax=Leptospira mayottensis TaxID=1137606 RepID=A0AA87MTI7_9LEPT|nr:D-glycero-beta-D-manno-heptose 1-phosphate adenylyltransferase [Leptospira mayottensis]AXR61539.1 D-glycero-beta-D-manno-heptose 1-phosphate adenylyltransferase [Leptospira mayottensis]AXR65197.1 D-glycero-beta-D-manno-heptose 1-phosphate adenylyltransferase [Leptospira mayottensis]AZQ02021.1 D-glycero-beta-D-manno-heptose 1-phosphate adenylyltransferase [Leptospira mayottensis 200901116]EKS01591.1 bifunctional protein RfaE, domain II [Leptospira mayottensis 200901122]TGN13560.1 D-glycero-b
MDLKIRIVPWENVTIFANRIRENQSIVFTNGCFDLLHRGHITYLSQARELGDFLWIGLNADSSVKRLKGEQRPVVPEDDRAILLSNLRFVDAVTIFSQDTPLELIRLIKPSIHVKGGDYKVEDLPETSIVREFGGKVEILPFVPGKSTSLLIEKILKL